MPRVKDKPLNDWGDAKKLRTYKLTEAAHSHLQKLADVHGISSRTDVIESFARPDGDLVAIPRHLLEIWMEDAKDKSSPRWERAQQMLEELREYLPTQTKPPPSPS